MYLFNESGTQIDNRWATCDPIIQKPCKPDRTLYNKKGQCCLVAKFVCVLLHVRWSTDCRERQFLSKGWNDFVEDHDLVVDDVLVFTLGLYNEIYVLIFGENHVNNSFN